MARQSKNQPSPREDLGPVRVRLELVSEPRITSGASPEREGEEAVGLLGELSALHARGWDSRATLGLGALSFGLDLSADSGQLEELWVFLLELAEGEGGEWTLSSGDDTVTLEAQVYGPDLIVDFDCSEPKGRFAGAVLPRQATLRLRAMICAGTALFRSFLKEALRLDAGMGDRPDLLAFYEDLDQLEAAVAELPGTFRSRDSA